MSSWCVVMSGLPASGKTTLGRQLAGALNLPCLDKDAFLEALFEIEGIGDRQWRSRLSRRSDRLFQLEAVNHRAAVLVSHWRAPGEFGEATKTGGSGTPSGWLHDSFETVIEVSCVCPAEIAAQRFTSRRRHPGHCDEERVFEEVLSSFEAYQKKLPLGLGTLLTVSTDASGHTRAEPPDVETLAGRIRAEALAADST